MSFTLVMMLTATLAAPIAAAELLHWRASRSDRVHRVPLPGRTAIVVLGFPSRRDGRLHPIQRWRTEVGVRTLSSLNAGFLVLTGGGAHGEVSEAEAMAAYAISLQVALDQIGLERKSRTTWENMSFALPMVDRYDAIAIASDPMHAARARRYALKQRPDLADRLLFADNYRFLERWWLKVPTAMYELFVAARRAPL